MYSTHLKTQVFRCQKASSEGLAPETDERPGVVASRPTCKPRRPSAPPLDASLHQLPVDMPRQTRATTSMTNKQPYHPLVEEAAGGEEKVRSLDRAMASKQLWQSHENAEKRREMYSSLLTAATLLLGFTTADISAFEREEWEPNYVSESVDYDGRLAADVFASLQAVAACIFLYETLFCMLAVVGGARMASLDVSPSRRLKLYGWTDDEESELPFFLTVSDETFLSWAKDPELLFKQPEAVRAGITAHCNFLDKHLLLAAREGEFDRHRTLAYNYLGWLGAFGTNTMKRLGNGTVCYFGSILIRLGLKQGQSLQSLIPTGVFLLCMATVLCAILRMWVKVLQVMD